MFAEFELKVHEMAEKGEPLTPESFCAVYHRLLELYFGPSVEIDSFMDWEWARIPHFTAPSMYSNMRPDFPPPLRSAAAFWMAKDGRATLPFLGAGGSDYPAQTLKRAGVDMSTPEPMRIALKEFADLVDDLTGLMDRG